MMFAHSISRASAFAVISFVVAVHGQEADSLVPIAMITHYSDNECSTLDVNSDFQGYYRNLNTKPGTAEADYTYFCDPAILSSYDAVYGIRNLDSCFVNNGGNWYFQPLGFCAAFVMNNETMSVKFSSIDYTTRKTFHSVYSDLECTVPKVLDAAASSGMCFVNDPKGKNGTDKVEAGFFSEIGSYQVIIPDAYNVISTSDACRIPSVLISFIGLFSLSSSIFMGR